MRVSIVSHGHATMVQALLHQMASRCAGSVSCVVLTHNIEEPAVLPPVAGWPFALDVRRNRVPRGFATNHNRALADAPEAFVCVLNPDVELLPGPDPLALLVREAGRAGVGCAYPVQVDRAGAVLDAERELPTPMALWRRRVLGQAQRRVDWVNGACMVLPTPVWNALGGFDEGYRMYCEDVDLCLRLTQAGWRLQRAPLRVAHVGQHASHRHPRYLAWHLRSLFRLWCSRPFWQALRRRGRTAPGGAGV